MVFCECNIIFIFFYAVAKVQFILNTKIAEVSKSIKKFIS